MPADPDQSAGRTGELDAEWARRNPGVPLRVLDTQYASIAGPVVAFIDELRQHHDEQILLLIPVPPPDRPRYRLLHNHLDVVLTKAPQTRTDMVVARVGIPLQVRDDGADPSHPVAGPKPGSCDLIGAHDLLGAWPDMMYPVPNVTCRMWTSSISCSR